MTTAVGSHKERNLRDLVFRFIKDGGRPLAFAQTIAAHARAFSSQELLKEASLLLRFYELADGIIGKNVDDANARTRLREYLSESLSSAWFCGIFLACEDASRERLAAIAKARAARRAASLPTQTAVASLAAPLLARKWTPHRIAGEICAQVNEQLAARGLPPLSTDAVRKRVQKLR